MSAIAKLARRPERAIPCEMRGFTLIEMMVSMAVFLVICGTAFTLLAMSQQRYQAESQTLNTFEEARLGLDQILRDVSDAGYPPQNMFQAQPPPNPTTYAVGPFAWSPYFPAPPCIIGSTCNEPGLFGMFLETNPTPQVPGSTVQEIRYKLLQNGSNILGRGVFPKTGADPYFAFPDTLLTPFVHNVMNYASPEEIAQINASYPNMFPGGNTVPLFTYLCDSPIPPSPQNCALMNGTALQVRSVMVTLIVAAPPDPQTGALRVIELTGQSSRINSFQ